METILQEAFRILEQQTVVSVQTAQETYLQCCQQLELAVTPLHLPDTEKKEPP